MPAQSEDDLSQFWWKLSFVSVFENVVFSHYGSKAWVQIWADGGAREFELETPNLLWLMFRLFSIYVPNVITFPHAVQWDAQTQQWKKMKNLTCVSEMATVFLNTIHSTFSEQGGAVSEPLYMKYFSMDCGSRASKENASRELLLPSRQAWLGFCYCNLK